MNVVAYWIVIRVTEWDYRRHFCVDYLSSLYIGSHPDDWYLSTTDDRVRPYDTEEDANYAIAQYGSDAKLVAVPINVKEEVNNG